MSGTAVQDDFLFWIANPCRARDHEDTVTRQHHGSVKSVRKKGLKSSTRVKFSKVALRIN